MISEQMVKVKILNWRACYVFHSYSLGFTHGNMNGGKWILALSNSIASEQLNIRIFRPTTCLLLQSLNRGSKIVANLFHVCNHRIYLQTLILGKSKNGTTDTDWMFVLLAHPIADFRHGTNRNTREPYMRRSAIALVITLLFRCSSSFVKKSVQFLSRSNKCCATNSGPTPDLLLKST